MALLRSDIINFDIIKEALKRFEKTKYVEIEAITNEELQDGILCENLKLSIEGKVRGKHRSYIWLVKLTSRYEAVARSASMLDMWPREVKVYQELFPYFEAVARPIPDVFVPFHQTLIHNDMTEKKECLIFNDLSQLGFLPSSFPLNLDSILLAVEWLARFHALGHSFYKSGHSTYWLRDSVPFAGMAYKNLLQELNQLGAVDDTSVQMEYASRLENLFSSQAYADICKTVFGPREKGFSTVCHGRPTVTNLLEWKNNHEENVSKPLECVFTNFSEARLCQPAVDLAILLYTSTSKALRKSQLNIILKSYHKELEDDLLGLGFDLNTYPYSQLVEDYQDAVVPAVGIAVNILPGLIGTGDDVDELDAAPASMVSTSGYSAISVLQDVIEELVEMGKI